MAETYWITFTIGEHGNSSGRHQALLAAVRRVTSDIWWAEASNFLMFHSERDIDEVAAAVDRAINEDTDLALLAKLNAQEAIAIGEIEDGLLFELMPFARRFHAGHVGAQPSGG
jgi:hypothetical protein